MQGSKIWEAKKIREQIPAAALHRRAERRGRAGVEVTVRDSGRGMTEREIEKALEPFETTKSTGSGLGLSIVQGIAEEHGGSVRAANRPEGGASVLIRLPISGADAPAGAPDMRRRSTG